MSTPQETYDTMSAMGTAKIMMPWHKQMIQGFMAGAYVALGALFGAPSHSILTHPAALRCHPRSLPLPEQLLTDRYGARGCLRIFTQPTRWRASSRTMGLRLGLPGSRREYTSSPATT